MKLTLKELREMIKETKEENYEVLLASPSKNKKNTMNDKALNEEAED
jgi:hypothetical protein